MKITIKSKLEGAAEEVFQAANWESAKAMLLDFIAESEINEKDKKKMLEDVKKLTNLVKIQTYFANSLLKYEGLSPNQK